MPTLEHDGVVEMFRDNPTLALRIMDELFHLPVPRFANVRVADSALNQLLPIEFRADLVLEVLDETGTFVLVIPLESQREISTRKLYTWPVYASVSSAERECPAVVLVVAVDADVATWASQAHDVGMGLGLFRPLVLGPATVPQISDVQRAREDVELAVLSAMAHGNGTNGIDVLRAAYEAITTLNNEDTLDQDHAMVYFQIIWNVLRSPMQAALKRLVMEKQSQLDRNGKLPSFLQEVRNWGFEEGEVKGFHDGEVKGFHDGEVKGFHDGEVKGFREGEVKGLRNVVLHQARKRGLVLTDEQITRVRECEDNAVLYQWLDRLDDAQTGDDIFR